jgi:hypothetical protein
MKKTLVLILFLGFNLIFSQTTEASNSDNTQTSYYIDKVDTMPEFPGGINEFRNVISRRFNTAVLSKINGTVKSQVKFSIDTDGSINSVTATGDSQFLNKEMERVINSIKKKWKPAMYNNQPVKYWFTIPFTMNGM